MSDEAADTATGAARNYLGALGFIIVLIGAEMMAEKEGHRFWLGFGLVIGGLPVFSAYFFWQWVKRHFNVKGGALSFLFNPLLLAIALAAAWIYFGYTMLDTPSAQGILWIAVSGLGFIYWYDRTYLRTTPERSQKLMIDTKTGGRMVPAAGLAGLYVGEMSFDISKLGPEKHIEIAIRVFNGTGSNIELRGINGEISYIDPLRETTKQLPTPSIRSDTQSIGPPNKEWFPILSQRVPAADADTIVRALRELSHVVIKFDLTRLNIMVLCDGKEVRLPLWSGATCRAGLSWGRIIHATVNIGGVHSGGSIGTS